MTSPSIWGGGLWALVIAGVTALMASLVVAVVPTEAVVLHRSSSHSTSSTLTYPADSLSRIVVSRDLFRSDRRPGLVAYDPSRGANPLPDGPPKPQLFLTGVVWGEESEAVVEGLPTTSGPRVVHVGDIVGGVTVKSIKQNQLVATGFDTTWILAVRMPWK